MLNRNIARMATVEQTGIMLLPYTPDQLKVVVMDAVREVIGAGVKPANEVEELLTITESVKFLKCSKPVFLQMRVDGVVVPAAYIGKRKDPRFRKSDLMKAMNNTEERR